MQFEGVGGIAMGNLSLEICWKVDDGNCFKRASKRVSTAHTWRIAPGTHFLTQIPQPMHRNSEMYAILSVGLTSIQSFPGSVLVRGIQYKNL